MIPAAIYVRISKDDKGESIENQRKLLEDYCRKHDFEIVSTYEDEAESGLFDTRPGFDKMLKDAKNRCFDVILAKNQSRFSRNYIHIEKYLHQQLAQLGIRFIGVTDGVDTGAANQRGSKKTRQIYALINEWYSQEISDNVRAVLKKKAEDGEFIGSLAPYGYEKSAKDSRKLTAKEPEASVVRRIYKDYLSGVPVKKLMQMCIEENYPPLDKKSGWTVRSIYRILENQCYTGVLIQGKTHMASYKSKKRINVSKEQQIYAYGAHEAIISEELFMQVQKKKIKRGRKKK